MSVITFGMFNPYEYAKCARVDEYSAIHGTPITEFCSIERRDYNCLDSCGKDAKYWEAK